MNWSLHRRTDLICLLITLVTVVVTVVFMFGESLGLTKITSDGAADRDGVFSERDYRDTWSEATAVHVDLSALDSLGNNGGAYVLNGDVHIVTSGTYVLTGDLDEHQVIVDAKSDKIQLVLNGVNLNHSTLSPINVVAADKVFLTLPENTTSVITTGNLSSPEASAAGTDAAIYAKSDLALNGSGALRVTATGGHGIKSTDDLIVTGGTYVVQAEKTAFLGKDSTRIADGNFTITGGEGIKANRTDKKNKGYVTIVGGSYQIDVDGDAIQAKTALKISGGDFQILTGGGASAASPHQEEFGGGPGGMGGGPMGGFGGSQGGEMSDQPGIPPDFDEEEFQEFLAQIDSRGQWQPPEFTENFNTENSFTPPENGNFDQNMSTGNRPQWAERERNENYVDEDGEDSSKGLKADTSIEISGGTFDLDCRDDAVHSDGTVTLTGGNLTIATGDDGVHADTDLMIDGATVTVAQSYEGIEGSPIYVYSGNIDVISSDDGFNASGGPGDGFGPWGSNTWEGELPLLQIDGGTIHVDASGDGLDSNGNLTINGGEIYIDGPTNSGNGALDSGSESGGDITVHGGTVVALGASGMAETFSSSSTQYSFAITLTSNYTTGDELTISNSSGEQLLRYTINKSGNSVVFSSPLLQKDETYTVTVGSQTQSVTMDSISVGESHGMSGGPMGGGFGGPEGTGGARGMGGGRGRHGMMGPGDNMSPPEPPQ